MTAGLIHMWLFIHVTVTDSVFVTESHVLKNSSVIYRMNELAVLISCEFKEGIERASCVLVYRKYGNKTLVVKEYPQNTVFPVTLTVDGDPENYTFAIFGKRGSDIDERPIVEGRVRIPTTLSTSPTRTPSGIVATVTSLCVVWCVE